MIGLKNLDVENKIELEKANTFPKDVLSKLLFILYNFSIIRGNLSLDTFYYLFTFLDTCMGEEEC